jgi:hypothetical protein
MLTYTSGTPVEIGPQARQKMNFPPGQATALHIAVHPGAFKVNDNTLTVVVERKGEEVTWAGAVDESMLSRDASNGWAQARTALNGRVGLGSRLWEIVYPGPLLKGDAAVGMMYRGSRPWLIIGELANGCPLAVPMNSTNRTESNKPYNLFLDKAWYVITPSATDPRMLQGDTNCTAELPHIWSLPKGLVKCGEVHEAHRGSLLQRMKVYYP